MQSPKIIRASNFVPIWYLFPLPYERDPGFRAVILRHCRLGGLTVGILGILSIAALMAGYVLMGREFAWSYVGIGPNRTVVLFDKLAVLVFSVASIVVSRFRPAWSRGAVSMFVIGVSAAIVMDDLATGRDSFTGYLILTTLAAVGTMPYQPWQSVLLGVALTFLYIGAMEFADQGMNMDATPEISGIVTLVIMTVIATGISALLYESRHILYQALNRTHELRKLARSHEVELRESLEHLKTTQTQLIQQEKLASLGALTAGIAHEIKNPLNFVNNFAELSADMIREVRMELEAKRDQPADEALSAVEDLLADLEANSSKIVNHGRRADAIVRSMLLHSRGTSGKRESTDLNALLEEYVKLSYHGMIGQYANFSVHVERDYDPDVGTLDVVPQELGRVFVNLLSNAFYAVHQKALFQDGSYAPAVSIHTRKLAGSVEIRIQDNGTGISDAIEDKIFEPFFTTKPTGSGTGLGLSISHGIVTQGHGGQMHFESKEGQFTVFTILLPVS